MVDLSFSSLGPDQTSPQAATPNDGDVQSANSLRISTGSPLSNHISNDEPTVDQHADHQPPTSNALETNPAPTPVTSPPSLPPPLTIEAASVDQSQQPEQQQQQQQDSTETITSPSVPAAGPSSMEHPATTSPDPASGSATTLTSASTATTPPVATAPPKRNLKFKISNRKKKDKNKHNTWWSPPIKVLIVEGKGLPL
jgi:osomolarity two-component system response regulator SSK1